MSDFKSQREIWAYLAADEKNRVTDGERIIGFQSGKLFNYTKQFDDDWAFNIFDDWSKHTPPKQKVKLYKYAYKTLRSLGWEETAAYFENDSDFSTYFPSIKNFLRLDNSCIEVSDD
jgi:hypothetical protein